MNKPTGSISTLAFIAGLISLTGIQPAWANESITASEADRCVGRVCRIEGTVTNVVTTRDHATVINFDLPSPKKPFTAVIASDSGFQFHDVQVYEGQKVRVTGLVQLRRGQLQAILTHPSQLAFVE